MAACWGTSIVWHKTSTLEGYEEDLGGGLDWPALLAPKTHSDLIGNTEARREICTWLDARISCSDSGLLVLVGAVGTGKTCTIEVESSLRQVHLIHMAADELRTGQHIESALNLAIVPGCMLFLDDANNLAEESTGLTAVIKAVRQALNKKKRRATAQPLRVIVCLDDPLDPKLRPLLHIEGAKVVHFHPIPAAEMVPYLRKCVDLLSRKLSYFEACKFAHFGNGDIRRTLMMMRIDCVGSREKIRNHSRAAAVVDLAEQASQEDPSAARSWLMKHYTIWPQHFEGGQALSSALSDAALLLSTDERNMLRSAGDADAVRSEGLTYAAISRVVQCTWKTLHVRPGAIDTLKSRFVRVAKVPKSALGQW